MPFGKAQVVVGDAAKAFSLFCNVSTMGQNQTVIWIQSIDKNNTNYVQVDGRITLSNNDLQLNFANLLLTDQEYYACILMTTKYVVLNQYFLYVRGNDKKVAQLINKVLKFLFIRL